MRGRFIASRAEFVFLNTIWIVLFVDLGNIVFFAADGASESYRFATGFVCHNVSLKLQM